mmetsp:Transcript_26599/g.26844  ORF Transcript_26599/g.26844 Transcript_26599/m.26844 type:complete len:260 (+) Transcript_26599:233-1012(+)
MVSHLITSLIAKQAKLVIDQSKNILRHQKFGLSSWRSYQRTVVRRDSAFSFIDRLNPDNVIYGIIGVNVGVFGLWQWSMSDRRTFKQMTDNFMISYYGIFQKHRYHTFFTSFFSHKDTLHLLLNMFMLYMFGPEIIYLLGVRRFLMLYTSGGFISGACHVFAPLFLPKSFPSRYSYFLYSPAMGASGAVNGIVIFHVLTYPTRILWLYFIIPIPALLAGTMFVLKDVYGLYLGDTGMGNAGHLGGAATGALYFLRRMMR